MMTTAGDVSTPVRMPDPFFIGGEMAARITPRAGASSIHGRFALTREGRCVRCTTCC